MEEKHRSAIVRWCWALGFGLLVTAMHFVAYVLFVSSFETSLLSMWFSLRGPLKPPSSVVIVAMTEGSYRTLGLSAENLWPRELYVPVLEKLAKAGAASVAFDVVFHPSPDAPKERDFALAKAMTLLPTVIGGDIVSHLELGPEGSVPRDEYLMPAPIFAQAAAQIGRVALRISKGQVKRFPGEKVISDKLRLSLSEAAASLSGRLTSHPGPSDFINFYGSFRKEAGPAVPSRKQAELVPSKQLGAIDANIPTVPIERLLGVGAPVPDEFFRGKVVFIGAQMMVRPNGEMKDMFDTPLGGQLFGVQIHATAAANLMDQSWINRAEPISETKVLHAALFVCVCVIALLSPVNGLTLTIALLVAWFFGAFHLFCAGWFIPGAGACVTLFLAWVVMLVKTLEQESRRKALFLSALSRYLPPSVARLISDNPKELSVGGELKTVVALFADIAGFTGLTEKTLRGKTTNLLKSYFTAVTGIAYQNEGTVLKHSGDSAFILWGAPAAVDDSCRKALNTALALQSRIAELRNTGAFPENKVRVGLHYGVAEVGNIGSDERFDYSAVGDVINVASRLEGLNKFFGTDVIASGEVVERIKDATNIFYLAKVRVSGREEALPVYTVFVPAIDSTIEVDWESALALFARREWAASAALFRKLRRADSRLTKSSLVYLLHIQRFLKRPPSENWSGEIIFGKK